MTVDPILQPLLELFRGKLGPDVQPDDDFGALDMDSLALAEISVVIERQFQVRLTERVLEVHSIRELAKLVSELTLAPMSRN